jgi:hypothetical protein
VFYDRRKAERVQVNLEASWEGVFARQDGLVADISMTGCFILTDDCVKQNELVRVEILMSADGRMSLWGEIVYKIAEMGFGVRFTHLSESEQKALAGVISRAREKKSVAAVPERIQGVLASARR